MKDYISSNDVSLYTDYDPHTDDSVETIFIDLFIITIILFHFRQ
jgi:hypothetical protein